MALTSDQIIKRMSRLDHERKTWETHWQELADFMLPRKNDILTRRHPGQKRNVQVIDNTGVIGLHTLAGSLQGLLTSPNTPWFELTTGNDEIDQEDDVRTWLQETQRKMLNVINQSNFQTEVAELYLDLVLFGTAAMSIEEDDETIVRFKTYFIRDYFVFENSKGFVDEIYRRWKWPARLIVDEFGLENLSDKIKKSYEKNEDSEYEIIHAVFPSSIAQESRSQAFTSKYILKEDKSILRESGFNEFPFVVPRWSKSSGEIYGRSPGMTALPEVKMANAMEEIQIKSMQKQMDPPLQLPDDGFILPIRTRPGSLNFYRAGSQDRIQPVFNQGRFDIGEASLESRRRRIREAFFVDQLQLQQGPQMTATEVLQRTEEKMRLLGPMLGRMQSEFLRPLIDRVFLVMLRQGRIRQQDIPEAIGRNFEVQFSSPIARSQKVTEAQNMLRFLEASAGFIQLDPNSADNINKDAAVRILANFFNTPANILNSEGTVQNIRRAKDAARQQELAAQQQQLQADAIAKAGPTIVAAQQNQG